MAHVRVALGLSLVLALIALIAPTHADAGGCAMRGLSVELVGTSRTFSRGLVVALTNGGGGTAIGTAPAGTTGDAGRFAIGAGLERGEEAIDLSVRALAPGLAVLVPSTPARVGPWTLHTRTARVPVRVRGGRAPAPLPAPIIAHVVLHRPEAPPSEADFGLLTGGSGHFTPPPQPTVSVELHGPAPEAIALVVYLVGDTAETAIDWSEVPSHAHQVQLVVHQGGRCTQAMMFRSLPQLGQHVTFAWVDADGRVSAHSADTVVAE
jgi:hypothetical protein